MDNIARIEYKGLEYSPEDYNATPGALSALVGVARSSRAPGLAAEPLPDVVMKLRDASHTLLLVHRDNAKEHYVCYDPKNKVVYEYLPSEEKDAEIYRLQQLEQLGKSTTMGRILILTISGRLHYVRLLETGEYQYLGEYPKPIWVEVKTQASVLRSVADDSVATDIGKYYPKDKVREIATSGGELYLDEEKKGAACDAIFGIINHYHARITADGCFHSPFFIRFAYRMYDGSHMGMSAPIFIVPNTLGKPELYVTYNGKSTYAAFLFASLDIISYNLVVDEEWRELITGVDVFASTPLYGYSDSNEAVKALVKDDGVDLARCMGTFRYYQGGTISGPIAISYGDSLKSIGGSNDWGYRYWGKTSRLHWIEKGNDYIFFAAIGDGSVESDFKCRYFAEGRDFGVLRTITKEEALGTYGISLPDSVKAYVHTKDDGKVGYAVLWTRSKKIESTQLYWRNAETEGGTLNVKIQLTRTDDKKIEDLVPEMGGFYLLDKLSMEYITGSPKVSGVVSPDRPYVVAPRFSANDIRILATKRQASPALLSDYQRPCEVRDLYAYNNRLHIVGDAVQYVGTPIVPYLNSQAAGILKISYAGRAWDVVSDTVRRDYVDSYKTPISEPYFFYTPLDAKSVVVKVSGDRLNQQSSSNRVIKLSPHPTLGGSYAFDFNGLFGYDEAVEPVETTRSTQSVYVSDTDNPWVYKASGAFSAGGERVLRLMANTRALSEGQFGSHPLYAFTEGGIWALQPTSQGSYMSVQPISRDVCTNPEGIVGLDTALVFPSMRGLMLLEGASVQCISDALDAEPDSLSRLPWAKDVLLDFGLDSSELETIPLRAIFSTAQIAYDNIHARIILFTRERQLALVYSLKTGLWSCINSLGASRAVLSYPEAYVQCNDGVVRDYTVPADNDGRFYLVTRPFSLGLQDVHKTIAAAIQRGNFTNNSIRCVLYGSQDLKTWHVVNSSTTHVLRGRSGTPYKCYRMLVFGQLNDGECLSGVDFDYRIRLQNKLR